MIYRYLTDNTITCIKGGSQIVTQVMSDLERIVYNFLIRMKISFDFQTSLRGGFYQLGGAVVDFILRENNIALRVFGEYWHRGIIKEGSDTIQREMLSELGFTVVDLWGNDLEQRLEQTMRLALQGQEMLR